MLLVTRSDGTFIHANRAYRATTGYGREDLISRSHHDVIHPDFRHRFQKAWDTVLAGETLADLKYRIFTRSDDVLALSSSLTPLAIAGNTPSIVLIRSNVVGQRRPGLKPHLERAWYPLLLERSQDGIVATNSRGEFLFANEAAAINLGYTLPELLLRSTADIDVQGFKSELTTHRSEMLRGRTLRFETRHRRKDGTLMDVEVSVGLFIHDGEPVLFSIWRDISQRKQAEEALRLSEDKFRTIVDRATDGILIVDAETRRFVEVNMTMCDMLGYQREEMLGLDIADIHPRQVVPMVISEFKRLVRLGEGITEGIPMLRRDGSVFCADIGFSTILLNDRNCAICFFHDMTERSRLEEALRKAQSGLERRVQERTLELQKEIADRVRVERALAAHMAQFQALSARLGAAREEERRTIARELHDEIGQQATGLKLGLDLLRRSATGEMADQIERLQDIAADIIDEVRNLSLVLRPSMLDDLGLAPALNWLFNRFTGQTGIAVDFLHEGLTRRFPTDTETVMYRAVQEAITNVARHTDVDSISVQIVADRHQIAVNIVDTGSGFRPDEVLYAARSVGLFGMRERVDSVGGTLTIKSAPGAGTTVGIAIPLEERSK